MRTLFLTVCLLSFAAAAQAETITATVNGLVCAFCATGIEKTFHKQPQVKDVHVDLDQKNVTIDTKPKQTLSDDKITELLTDAGYTVTDITRAP